MGGSLLEKVIQQLKGGSMVFPRVLFDSYKELNINHQELVFLIYLLNESCRLDPSIMSDKLNITIPDFMRMIDNLVGKDLIKIELKSQGVKKEEWISLEPMYKKIALFLVSNPEEDEKVTNLYSEFEQEFGRALSPMEYELISGWISNGSTEETIRLALKEAVYNGVFKLKYIDSILYEWGKKGIKTKEDVLKDRKNFQNKNKNKELFDYDWLNENDE